MRRIRSLLSDAASDFERDKQNYRRLLEYLHPYRQRFFFGLLASIPASALEGGLAFMIGPFLDRLLKSQGHDYSSLMILPAAVIAACVFQGVFDYISQYLSTYVGNRICIDIQKELYRHLIGMDLNFYKKTTLGDILTRYYQDPHKLQQAIVTNLQGFMIQLFTLVFLAAVLLIRNWHLSLIALGIISIIGIPMIYLSKRIRALDYQLRQASASVNTIFNETVYGVREIKSFNLYRKQLKSFDRIRQQIYDTTMDTAKKSIVLSPIMQVIAGVGIATILFLGVLEVQAGTMTPGNLTSFLVALVLLYKPVKAVTSTMGKIQIILAPAERVFHLLDTTAEMKDAPDPVRIDRFESLEFRNTSFHYGEDKQVLREVNLTITPGQTVAIIGTSGGGKTTLVDMVSRFIDPTGGEVLMNGYDMRTLSIGDIRALVAMVSQETMMFNGSIRDNILMGRADATDSELAQALKVAHLADWVASLPDGVDTSVGDRGSFLSGGQKQRVAIARAYLKQAPILVLDEATSALDNESEAIVQQALMGLMKDKTVIMIAHRLSTVHNADRILVMENGQIIESGTHDELMVLNGLYNKLYSLQFRQQERDLLKINT